MMRSTGVILAGGGATRYGGEPKGLERVAGERIIDRVARALGTVTKSLLLIANDPASSQWLPGVRRAGDVRMQAGSLGGIHSALVHAGTPVLVVAWDMPFVNEGLLAAMLEVSLATDADVVVPESDSRRGVEPLCAWYSQACVAPIERRIDADDLRVISFFEDVRVERLPAARVATFGDPEMLFMNVNSPADLERAEAHATSTDGGRRRQEA